MPLPLSAAAISEKNKLATDSVFLVAMAITIPGVSDPVRVVANSENITWQGETWIAFDFEIEEITEGSDGATPRVDVKVSNVSRAMEAVLQAYDLYTKTNGYTPITVNIYVVNSANLASATPEVEHVFELVQPRTDSKWATFTLGAANPFNQRFPGNRILKLFCRWPFKSDWCGYSGAETTCNKTLARCRELSNSARFGGAPGVGYGGVIVSS